MSQTVSDSCCDVSRIDTRKIEHLLESGKLDTCRDTVEQFLQDIHFRELESLMLRLYVTMDIYIAARSFSRELGIGNDTFIERFGSIDEISGKMQTAEGTAAFLHEMLYQCIRWRIDAAAGTGHSVVAKAKEYIDANYMNDELSLRTVADAVGLSPSYLSAVFKREVKQNFSDYLTEVRIRRAKELLCCTSKMIYEVAYAVGFRDYRYFGQIFKKQTGLTPKQFQSHTNVC